jgi:hypothetical protein
LESLQHEIDSHLLHNMINRYLKRFVQAAMKISLAMQIMRNTVAAAIDTHVTAGKVKCF